MTSGGEPAQIEKRMVVEYGVTLDGVWLPLAMLRRLGTHGPWDNRSRRSPVPDRRTTLRRRD